MARGSRREEGSSRRAIVVVDETAKHGTGGDFAFFRVIPRAFWDVKAQGTMETAVGPKKSVR